MLARKGKDSDDPAEDAYAVGECPVFVGSFLDGLVSESHVEHSGVEVGRGAWYGVWNRELINIDHISRTS